MHCIHLRHPWQSHTRGESTVWSRKFNWPSQLESGDVVELVVEPVSLAAAITLNDQALALSSRTDITAQLKTFNQVAIAAPTDPEACPFTVKLEIKKIGA